MNKLIHTACHQSLKQQKSIKMFLASAVIEGVVTDIQELCVEMRTAAKKRIIIKLDCVQAIELD
ncbi:hypothetical protein MNBD_BACTEROID03-2265 [hydrothermal vent metagenome]|uniref:Uncharacterized protein n=1 Tax=hydrothermal vent metagenome TaxID=652676 RepID=A0A3B0SZN7_9ZZZZ